MSRSDFAALRRAMVSNQLRTNQVTDAAVLAAMDVVPRERFVAADQAAVAYRDTGVPLGEGRWLNPPVATGRLLDAVRPRTGERVLVVGSATGYAAAVLAGIGCAVTALEESVALIERAEGPCVTGPLAAGWPDAAPYDVIVIDGAVERIPDAIIEQLAEGGRLAAGLTDRGVGRLVVGRRVAGAPGAGGFGIEAFADADIAPLPGFAPAPVFTF